MKRLLLLIMALAVIIPGCIRKNEEKITPQQQPEAENQKSALDSLLEEYDTGRKDETALNGGY